MKANMTEMLSYHNVLSLDALTALYCRLSVDDANDGDSNSIQNQKEMLKRYCKENGFTNYRFMLMMAIPARPLTALIFKEW